MNVEERTAPAGSVLLVVSGEVDLSATELQEAIERAILRGVQSLSIDLSDVAFIDSSGLAILLAAARRVNSIEILHPSKTVLHVIELTGLSDVLHVVP